MSKKVVGIPVFVVDAPMPKMKPPRKPMTKEELACNMYEIQKDDFPNRITAPPWEELEPYWQEVFIKRPRKPSEHLERIKI